MELLDVLFIALVVWIAWELISNGGGGGHRARLPMMAA